MNILDINLKTLNDRLSQLQILNQEGILHMSEDTVKLLPSEDIEYDMGNNIDSTDGENNNKTVYSIRVSYKGYKIYNDSDLDLGEIKLYQEVR